jgi:hypothetical protein
MATSRAEKIVPSRRRACGRPAFQVVRAATHLQTASPVLPLDVHLVTDQLRSDAPLGWRQHLLSSLPADAAELHRQYIRRTHGPGSIYMYKTLLHKLLPAELERVLVLDTDLYIPAPHDLRGLYAEFDAFPPSAVLGVANEQQPTYWPTFGKLAGSNGGVQLQHLARMRDTSDPNGPGARYAAELARCATGACGDIGYLGDQTCVT